MNDFTVHKQREVGLVEIKPLKDNSLSSEAKGIFAIMQAVLGENKTIEVNDLLPYVKEYALDVNLALAELREKGYITMEE